MKQPFVGLFASAVIIAVSLGFISLFSFPTFAGWVSYYLVCVVPIQLIIGVAWGCKQPAGVAALAQPGKGIILTALALAVGALTALLFFITAGGSVSPPTPMLVQFSIAVVVTSFWMIIILGGWPFTKIKSPIASGLTLLSGCYVVAYLLFRLLFNYGFMKGAPVYVGSLDPQGLFNAWEVLSFYLSVMFGLFFMINFELWPLTKFPAIMQQPKLGAVWTLCTVGIGAITFYVGTVLLKTDPAVLMVRFSITFIFGVIIMQNMLHNSLFARLTQPLKGIMNTVGSVVFGFGLSAMYGALCPMVSGKLHSGPPTYDFEVWLASALLGVTFPFLTFGGAFFEMWPLTRAAAKAESAPRAASVAHGR